MDSYLSARRKELGKTQKEVADYIGVTEATVSRWESGNIANMRRDKIQKYAEILETTPSKIMNLDSIDEKTAVPEDSGLTDTQRELIKVVGNLSESESAAILALARSLEAGRRGLSSE